MRPETYDYLFENALLRGIEDVLNGIPDEAKERYSLSYENGFESRKQAIIQEYELQRDNVKERFYDAGEGNDKRIDIHKISACFTVAVLKARVFTYKAEISMDMSVFYSNYTLAFLSGVHLLYLCMISDLERDGRKDMAELLKNQATLKFPKTNQGHDEYLQGRVKTLALNDLYGIDFDVLTYADMMFWIEKYNLDELAKAAGQGFC